MYRATLDERARIEAEGGRVTRVRIDAELKAYVATATERARAEGGDRAADEGRWCADSARWASSGRHVDHRDRRRVRISM